VVEKVINYDVENATNERTFMLDCTMLWWRHKQEIKFFYRGDCSLVLTEIQYREIQW